MPPYAEVDENAVNEGFQPRYVVDEPLPAFQSNPPALDEETSSTQHGAFVQGTSTHRRSATIASGQDVLQRTSQFQFTREKTPRSSLGSSPAVHAVANLPPPRTEHILDFTINNHVSLALQLLSRAKQNHRKPLFYEKDSIAGTVELEISKPEPIKSVLLLVSTQPNGMSLCWF